MVVAFIFGSTMPVPSRTFILIISSMKNTIISKISWYDVSACWSLELSPSLISRAESCSGTLPSEIPPCHYIPSRLQHLLFCWVYLYYFPLKRMCLSDIRSLAKEPVKNEPFLVVCKYQHRHQKALFAPGFRYRRSNCWQKFLWILCCHASQTESLLFWSHLQDLPGPLFDVFPKCPHHFILHLWNFMLLRFNCQQMFVCFHNVEIRCKGHREASWCIPRLISQLM